jgi:hypothetical protein
VVERQASPSCKACPKERDQLRPRARRANITCLQPAVLAVVHTFSKASLPPVVHALSKVSIPQGLTARSGRRRQAAQKQRAPGRRAHALGNRTPAGWKHAELGIDACGARALSAH